MPRTPRSKQNNSSESPSPTNGASAEKGAKSLRNGKRKRLSSKRTLQRRGAGISRSRGRRKRYSDVERAKILETAKREGLTGAQVKERFGVSTLTYYLWRKKSKAETRRPVGRPRRPNLDGMDLEGQVRQAVRERIKELLPLVIQQEAGRFLADRLKGR